MYFSFKEVEDAYLERTLVGINYNSSNIN